MTVPTRDELMVRAKLSEKTERYDDLKLTMKRVVEMGQDLTNDERNLLSVGYRYAIAQRRTSWRVISSIEQKEEDLNEEQQDMLKEYREKIESEIETIGQEIIGLLDTHLLKVASNSESKVFYLKMRADYYRYQVEVETEPDKRKKLVSMAEKSYRAAKELATTSMKPTNPIRLGVVLNYSVFTFEMKYAYKKAVNMAKEAFEDALKNLDLLHQQSYKDSNIILQLLNSNVKTWSAAEGKPEDFLQTD